MHVSNVVYIFRLMEYFRICPNKVVLPIHMTDLCSSFTVTAEILQLQGILSEKEGTVNCLNHVQAPLQP